MKTQKNFFSDKILFFIIFITHIGIVNFGHTQSKTFFLGHSLINFNVPNMTNRLAQADNQDFIYKRNIGNGANLSFHYTNPYSPGSQGDVWKNTMPEGGFTDFVFTEAVPLKGHLQWSKTYEYADSFAIYFRKDNPNSRIFLYETWHCIKSGTPQGCEWENEDKDPWIVRLKNDFSLWKGIVDHMKDKGHKDVFMVPAGQAFINLDEEIKKGNLPGINNVFDLFSDDIHLTNLGNYFIACLMFGVIFKESPVGLPARLKDEYEVLYNVYPTEEQARVFQNTAWKTLCAVELSGVNCTSSAIEKDDAIFETRSENGKLLFETKMDGIEIYSIEGKKVSGCLQCKEIDLPTFSKYLYFVSMKKGNIQKSTIISNLRY